MDEPLLFSKNYQDCYSEYYKKKGVRMHILLTACQHGKRNLGLRTILLFFITSDFYIHCCAKQNCPPAKISSDATADGEKSMNRRHIF